MDQNTRDDALFEALNHKKKKRKRKIIRTVIIVVVLLAAALVGGTLYLRRQVAVRFASGSGDVTSAQAELGSISTQVSGSGTLMNVDEESLTMPAGVTVEEVLVSAHDQVTEGQLLVKADTASVLTAMSTLQEQITSIDSDITSAGSDTVSSSVTTGVAGRVKRVYAEKGDDVVACMVENGALAILSLDGYLSVEIDADVLEAGDSVTVLLADSTEESGAVDSTLNGKATILISDRTAEPDQTVTVLDASGRELGNGTLHIHSPLRISGISGTVAYAYASENQEVYAGSVLFTLTDTTYTARYQTLVKEREEQEDALLELMEIYRNGGVVAPFSGSVSSVDYDEDMVDVTLETDLVTLSPDRDMEVTINVDESNIMSLEVGQSATITVSSIGDDVFNGVVTEINKTASSASGVTRYSAVVTLDKTPAMLQGMTAKVVVRIQGVENAVIIPVDALHQTSSSSYVYTSYDEELKEFGGLKEVTVGITNSSYAEITSGLREGETVWYTEAETNPFGNMGFPGGGDFPGGGNNGGGMPGGGNFGGNGGGSFGGGGGMPGGNGGNRPGGRG